MVFRKLALFSFVVLSSIMPSRALAAGSQTGTITSLFVTSGNVGGSTDALVYFYLTGTRQGTPPACATAAYWMIRDAKSVVGQELIALLLTAKSTGQVITVNGTGQCVRWPDGEDIQNIVQ